MLASRIALLLACSLATLPACSGAEAPRDGGPELPSCEGTERGHRAPPAQGPLVTPDGSGPLTFAITKILLGETDRDGNPGFPDIWKQIGYDLDGVDTFEVCDKAMESLCAPRNDAERKNLLDGDDGIDNSFGGVLYPILRGLDDTLEQKANFVLDQGGATVLIDLDDVGAGDTYAPLGARLHHAATLDHVPLLDGSDVWPIQDDLLDDPSDPGSAKLQSGESYLVEGVWVGRFKGGLPIAITLGGKTILITILDPTVTMTLDPGRAGATNGTIAGVLAVDPLLATAREIAALQDPALCTETSLVLQTLLARVERSADILLDRSQDPAKTCDAVSIGLGFEATRVVLGPVVAAEPISSACN
jgi:hypothetical protein